MTFLPYPCGKDSGVGLGLNQNLSRPDEARDQ
jgi:hypothetical protein